MTLKCSAGGVRAPRHKIPRRDRSFAPHPRRACPNRVGGRYGPHRTPARRAGSPNGHTLAAAPASPRRHRLGRGATRCAVAQELGFDHRFEALVAKVAGGFLASHDPARERRWIAERSGVNIGSVFLVRESDEIAKLRLLLVKPAARGLGIGRRLVAECIGFARNAGYRGVTLWTNDALTAARAIYQQAGFRLTASPHRNFGPPMVGEDWDLKLR
jgi:GNAT superfamily N-acetyltransferase